LQLRAVSSGLSREIGVSQLHLGWRTYVNPIPTAFKLVTHLYLGPSRMEHPCTSCHGLIRGGLSTRLHQHRINNSPTIDLVSRRGCHPQLLPGRDRHVNLATAVWRTTPSSQVVAGQIWTCHQYRGSLLHLAALVLCVLAYSYAGDSRDDELGERHILGCIAYSCGLLRR
jgi:hypothetical protein